MTGTILRILNTVVLAFLCMGSQAPPQAQKKLTPLIIAFDQNDFLPYYQARADNTVSGFARDLLDQFARDEGYTIDFQVYPLNRVQQLQLQGKIDLRFPDSPLWALDKEKGSKIAYSRPIVSYTDGI